MRRTAATAAIGTLLLATACGGSSGQQAATGAAQPGATVDMVFTEFKQTDVAIKAGQAVTFVNQNPITHVIVGGSYTVDPGTGLRTAEQADGAFSLKASKKGDRVAHTFAKAGTYRFFCTIHKGMNGAVTVG
ncbi:MAG: hypothetical protein JWN87_929 [Frankiales bacterium]|nr:hypothetical protein [Frankiales bacterium]